SPSSCQLLLLIRLAICLPDPLWYRICQYPSKWFKPEPGQEKFNICIPETLELDAEDDDRGFQPTNLPSIVIHTLSHLLSFSESYFSVLAVEDNCTKPELNMSENFYLKR